MKNNREKLQFHNNPYITQMLLLVLFITGLLGMSCKVQCAAAPALRIMKGYGEQALSDYSLCKEFTASDFSQDRIFTNSRRKIYFTGDHFVLSFAHGITAGAILEGCGIEPAQVEAIYFGDSLRFTMEELYGEADEVRQNIPDASSIVSYGPDGELIAGEYLLSYWEEDLLALFSDNYDYAIGETMDAYYDSSLIGRKWGEFYYMTQDQSQVEASLRRGLTFYYGQLDPLDVNLPVEGIHTVYIQMKKEVSGGISDGNGSGDSSGGGSSDGNGSGSGSSGSGSSGNESSGNNSTGSNSSGSSRTGANNKGSKKTLKNSDGSNNKKASSGRAGNNKSSRSSNNSKSNNNSSGSNNSKSNNNSSGSGKNSAAKTSDTTTSAAERSAAESSTAEMTDKKENNNANDTGTDAAGYRKDNSENEDEDPDQDQENEAKETPSQKTDSPGVLRLKDAGSNIEAKAAADMQADSKVLYGTALLVLLGIAAGLVGFRRQMRQSGESGYGRK